MTTSTFPVRPEQLTATWLTQLLRDAGDLASGTKVTALRTRPVGDVVGVMGDVVRVLLDYDRPGAGPASLVIKFAHRNAENRAIANNTRMYEREVAFFNEVSKLVDMPMTKCYFAAMDPVTGGNAVVIEDLVGYEVGDQVRGVTLDQVKMVIDAIAPLHARFFGKWRDAFPNMMTIDSPAYIEGFTPGFFGTWEQSIQKFPECYPPAMLAAMPKYVAGLKEVMRAMGRRTLTFVHGDVRTDNAMFGHGKPGLLPVILIDWQNMMISNPLQDLAWLAATSLTVETRRRIEAEMLAYYGQQMAAQGVTGYGAGQIRDDYDMALLFVLNFNILIAGAFVAASERDRQMASEGLSRAITAVLDRDLLRLLPG